jgi:hypothetical protein
LIMRSVIPFLDIYNLINTNYVAPLIKLQINLDLVVASQKCPLFLHNAFPVSLRVTNDGHHTPLFKFNFELFRMTCLPKQDHFMNNQKGLVEQSNHKKKKKRIRKNSQTLYKIGLNYPICRTNPLHIPLLWYTAHLPPPTLINPHLTANVRSQTDLPVYE